MCNGSHKGDTQVNNNAKNKSLSDQTWQIYPQWKNAGKQKNKPQKTPAANNLTRIVQCYS